MYSSLHTAGQDDGPLVALIFPCRILSAMDRDIDVPIGDCVTEPSLLSEMSGLAADAWSGIPGPVRKNAIKAFGQLCTAAIQVPIALLAGKAREIAAETDARVKLIEKSAAQISNGLEVDPEFAALAATKFSHRIVRQHLNVEKIGKIASDDLLASAANNSKSTDEEISDDWLNNFEREAVEKSSSEMQALFGRILSEEIKRPGAFSVHTVRLIGQLDATVAKLFVRFCSISLSIGLLEDIDNRVVSFGKAPANTLKEFGLNYTSLVLLQEYGLLSAELDSTASYEGSIAHDGFQPIVPIRHAGKDWRLRPSSASDRSSIQKVRGVSLTKAGREVAKIIDVVPDEEYTKLVIKFFSGIGYEMIPL